MQMYAIIVVILLTSLHQLILNSMKAKLIYMSIKDDGSNNRCGIEMFVVHRIIIIINNALINLLFDKHCTQVKNHTQ